MTATSTSSVVVPPESQPPASPPAARRGPSKALHDGYIVTRRNVIKIKRIPDVLIFSTVQPIMFVLLFAYVFGSAIPVPGGNYREFLMAGIFTQTVVFGSAITAIGLADDMQKGIIDRFRSLPLARSAVLVGRTTSDLLNNVITVVVMSLTGLLVGWRIEDGVLRALGAYALLLFFAYCMSWVSAVIGLTVRSVEVAQSAGFIWLFPVTFLSNAFVPIGGLPGWLQTVAQWNPITTVVAATRELFGNPTGNPPLDSFPAQQPLLYTLIWCAGLLLVFVPLAVWKYRSATAR